MSADLTPEPLLIACLCAQWCTTCTEYRGILRALDDPRIAWVDIEDHADLLERLDIETFPTLLIARGDDVVFYGPVPPTAAQLSLLLRGAGAGTLTQAPDEETRELLERVREVIAKREASTVLRQ